MIVLGGRSDELVEVILGGERVCARCATTRSSIRDLLRKRSGADKPEMFNISRSSFLYFASVWKHFGAVLAVRHFCLGSTADLLVRSGLLHTIRAITTPIFSGSRVASLAFADL